VRTLSFYGNPDSLYENYDIHCNNSNNYTAGCTYFLYLLFPAFTVEPVELTANFDVVSQTGDRLGGGEGTGRDWAGDTGKVKTQTEE
jgi:hypothetical protein